MSTNEPLPHIDWIATTCEDDSDAREIQREVDARNREIDAYNQKLKEQNDNS